MGYYCGMVEYRYKNTPSSSPTFWQTLKKYKASNTRRQSSYVSVEPLKFNYVCSDQQRTASQAVLLQQVQPGCTSLRGKNTLMWCYLHCKLCSCINLKFHTLLFKLHNFLSNFILLSRSCPSNSGTVKTAPFAPSFKQSCHQLASVRRTAWECLTIPVCRAWPAHVRAPLQTPLLVPGYWGAQTPQLSLWVWVCPASTVGPLPFRILQSA